MLINFIPMKVYAKPANMFNGLNTKVNVEEVEGKVFGLTLQRMYFLNVENKRYCTTATSHGGGATVLEPKKMSTLDLIGIAYSITNGGISQDDYAKDIEGITASELVDAFGFDADLDDKANSDLGVLRDLAVCTAVKQLDDNKDNLVDLIGGNQEDTQRKLNNIMQVMKNKGGTDLKKGARTNVIYDCFGWDFNTLELKASGLIQEMQNSQSDNVRDEYLKTIDEPWDSNDVYESTRRAVMFLTDPNNASYERVAVVVGAQDYYHKYNAGTREYLVGYDGSNSNQKLLNTIIDTMIRSKDIFGDQSKNLSILSTVMQRGSAYSYSKNGTKDIAYNLDLQKSSINPQAKAEMEDINRSVEEVIKNSGKDTVTSRMMYTIGLRMQFAFYAMQYSDGDIVDGMAKQLCFEESDGFDLRTAPAITPSPYQINNLEGFVMLNNVINEYEYISSVILPVLGGIKSKDELTRDKKTQLRYLRSAYDGWIFMRDKSNIIPIECLKPLQNAWEKKVKVTINGEEIETSLAETFDRLSQFIDMDNLDEGDISDGKPLRKFFDSSSKELIPNLKYGIALSASYVPFKTNVYETITYKPLVGKEDFFNFHVLYGYYRKALYIDTNISSVSENMTTGKVGNLKLCTLKDLLQCEKEISLYTDDNFYNIKQLQQYKDEAIAREQKEEANEDKGVVKSLIDRIKTANDIDLSQVLKTGSNEKYPQEMYSLHDYETSKKDKSDSEMEQIVLDGNDIDTYLGNNEELTDPSYNVMTAYAVTSGIARDPAVLDMCKNNTRVSVFRSSKNVAKMPSAESAWKNSIINYLILKNVKDNMNVSYTSNLDMNKPVYMDIYGNILTESGYVVIPAASNATLNKEYEPYNSGFLTTYGKEYLLPKEYANYMGDTDDSVSSSPLSAVLAYNEETGVYELQGTQEGTDVVDLSAIILSNEENLTNLINVYGEGLMSNLDLDIYIPNVVLEVLRGAPLENIDKAEEGLLVGNLIGDNGVEQAAKLEIFQENFNKNTQDMVMSLPNVAFSAGVEYVIPLMVKAIIIAVVIMTFKYVYLLGVKRQFSVREIGRYFLVLSLTLFALYIVPKFFNFSYYWSNKALLQDEALNIAMLNTEKREYGVEVGVQSVEEASPKTTLYLKMEDLNIPWYRVLRDISTAPILESLTELYQRYASENLAFSAKDFEFIAGDLYVDIDNILNSSVVVFNPNYKTIYDMTVQETPVSYYSPYYVFLHSLTVDTNMFNINNKVYSYTAQTYKDGKLKSIGLVKPYFESEYFQTDENSDEVRTDDLLHLREIYNKDTLSMVNNLFKDDLENIQSSLWCDTDISDEQFEERLVKMNTRAKKFVAKHQQLLGRISDETFLKMMALDLAMYHNRLFNVGVADNLEIFNLASEDIARLAIASDNEVISTSPLSFARFVYEEGGEPSIYFATILIVLFFLNGWVSPIVILFVFIAMFSSLFVRRIIFEKRDDSVKGYFMIGLYMGGTCWAYALLTKVCTLIAEINPSPILGILLMSIVHIAQILMMLYIGSVVTLNWKDLGAAQFSETNIKIGNILKAVAGSASRMTDKVGQEMIAGHEKLRELQERHRKRKDAKKERNHYDKDDDVMINDSAIYRTSSNTRRRDNDYDDYSTERYDEYNYSGGKFVNVRNRHGDSEKVSVEEFRRRYQEEPTINSQRDLTDRLDEKLNFNGNSGKSTNKVNSNDRRNDDIDYERRRERERNREEGEKEYKRYVGKYKGNKKFKDKKRK